MYTHEPHTRRCCPPLQMAVERPPFPPPFTPDPRSPPISKTTQRRMPRWKPDFSYIMGDTSLPVEEQEPEVVVAPPKRKRNANSDHPLQEWKKHRDEYLDEMLRLEGRGPLMLMVLVSPAAWVTDFLLRSAVVSRRRNVLCCVYCTATRMLPMHWIEEWNGEYFDRTSLYVLGLVSSSGIPRF
ncbi:hypothetical protein B0H13DRAFT_2369991 [Mycena leptocephala]|nr:hypothetical protein B0H13DRAFT_2371567 [Mycena leptocephala]KAJ7834289.1 hypothetical protein B0H13DRAFT_2369991 [Mycena leptocephala]